MAGGRDKAADGVPTLIWGGLAVVVVALFVLLAVLFKGGGAGGAAGTPDIEATTPGAASVGAPGGPQTGAAPAAATVRPAEG